MSNNPSIPASILTFPLDLSKLSLAELKDLQAKVELLLKLQEHFELVPRANTEQGDNV